MPAMVFRLFDITRWHVILELFFGLAEDERFSVDIVNLSVMTVG